MAVEIIIDKKRKRNWPKDLKRQIVAESYAEGVSVCEVARGYDLEPSQLFHWRKQFRGDAGKVGQVRLDAPAEFLSVEVAMGDAVEGGKPAAVTMDRSASPAGAEIVFPNGRRLFVAAGLDRRLLEELIGAVASS